MKIVESSDGTVKVIELDPTRWHWLIVDDDCKLDLAASRFVDGMILIKRAGSRIEIIEGAERVLNREEER